MFEMEASKIVLYRNTIAGKNLSSFIIWIFILTLLSSCSSGLKTTMIQKRNFRPGYAINIKTGLFHKMEHGIKAIENNDSAGSDQESNIVVSAQNFNKTPLEIGPRRQKLKTRPLNKLTQFESSVDKGQMVPPVFVDQGFDLKQGFKPLVEEPVENPKMVSKGLIGVLALIIALINLAIFMWVPFLGILSGILCIVLAVKALKIDHKDSKTMAGASLVITALTLFVSFFISLIVILGLGLHPIF